MLQRSCFRVPGPGRSVGQEQRVLRPGQSFPQGFPVESLPQFQRLVLPTDDQLVDQQAAAARGARSFLVPIEHAQLQFVPFDAVFAGLLLAPAGPAIAQLTAIHQQHAQLAGATLGQTFLGWCLIASLRLAFRPGAHTLHQRMQGGVIHGLRPFAGDLRRFLVRPGRRRRKAKLLRKTGSDLLVRPQLPLLTEGAAPPARAGFLSVINNEFDFAQLAAQR